MVIDMRDADCSFGKEEEGVMYKSPKQDEDKQVESSDEDDKIVVDERVREFEVALKRSIEEIGKSLGSLGG